MKRILSGAAVLCGLAIMGEVRAADCDKTCLENIATAFRTAYRMHDPSLAPFAARVRFTENNAEMTFPDGTWDTVTQEVGTPLVLSDPSAGQVGIYTSILQRQVPGFLAVRLKVKGGRIVEVEQVVATPRTLSGPPTPIGDIWIYDRVPLLNSVVPPADRLPRAELARLADAYFSTLQFNTGDLHGLRFGAGALRHENGQRFAQIEQGFRSGRYRYNNRVRDRDCFLTDEERGFIMCRGFIDHKGVLNEYTLTDGTPMRSNYSEPQSWGFLEAFKVNRDGIVAVEATFSAVPYFLRSPWTRKPDPTYDASKVP
jgi:hypothetical protein